jgi:Tol biopolymer transport system component
MGSSDFSDPANYARQKLMKLKHWSWVVIAVAFTLATAMTWLGYRALSVADEDLAARVGIRYLTHDPAATDYWPVFSPDGKSVLFSRQLFGEHQWNFFSVSAHGGEARPFMRSNLRISATRANWSGKTNVIAFTNVTSGRTSDTWLVNGDGTQPRALSIQGLSGQTDYPSWYPDGNTFALMDADKEILQRVDVQQGIATPITKRDVLMTGMPSVSPDGQCVAFAGQKNLGQAYDQSKNAIWLICNDSDAHPLEADPRQGRAPTWSPDGKRIAFESNRGSPVTALYAIFVIKRDGTNPKQVTPYWINANHPVWSPDGKQVVFTARQRKRGFRSGPGIAMTTVQY